MSVLIFLKTYFSEILTGTSLILLLWLIPDVILMLVVNIDRMFEMDNEQIEELLKQADEEQEHERSKN